MRGDTTSIAGIEIPSSDPLSLAIVIVHILVGIVCVAAGAVAMVSPKRPGRHPTLGNIYFWSLAAVFATATALSIMLWAENYHLSILGTLAFASALAGRRARRRLWPTWAQWHITGMGLSYVLLLTAFYVDNGKQLPVWKDLPHWTYWTLPSLVGVPIIIWTLLRHPLSRRASAVE